MEQSINPDFKPVPKKLPVLNELFQELIQGKKSALSAAITLVESNDSSQKKLGRELVKMAFSHSGKSKRIGITGVPGAGKSTLIESLGKMIIQKGGKVAVLAIDPSSTLNKGSILGDKTRMEELSVNPNAFIRPTPSGLELGGVARNTFEALILCEAAGYDHILIETVGVGQSEVEVKNLTDFFVMLSITGAGDDLQGIKRGIMEMADLIVVNKADGSNMKKAQETAKELQSAMSILGIQATGWEAKVITASGLENNNIDVLLDISKQYFMHLDLNDQLNKVRTQQQLHFFTKSLKHAVLDLFIEKYALQNEIKQAEKLISEAQLSAFSALDSIIERIHNK